MIKNRTTQLIFQTIYCTLGVVGVVGVIKWVVILLTAFIAVGYVFLGLDKITKAEKK